jgi:hypothetical protein
MEDEAKARKLDGCPNQLQMIKQLRSVKTAKFSKKSHQNNLHREFKF